MKRFISILMAMVMILSLVPVSCLSVFAEGEILYGVGSAFEFGTYPQSEVKDEALIEALNSQVGTWESYKYYYGTDTRNDGKMQPGDFMSYKDITYKGHKYRGVNIVEYRPANTSFKPSDINSLIDEYGYEKNTTYWFSFDPIWWVVLSPWSGYVTTKYLIDAQPFSNFIMTEAGVKDICENTAQWGNAEKTYYANNYEQSSIRAWLNEDFYNTAFNSSEKTVITLATVSNSGEHAGYSSYACPDTKDYVTLLSYKDVKTSSFGFSSNNEYTTTRTMTGTDYAYIQGLYKASNGNSTWLLRSASNSGGVCCDVDEKGYIYTYNVYVNQANVGIRPAMYLSNAFFSGEYCMKHVEDEGAVVTEPTCTENGRKEFKCTLCDAVVRDEIIPAKGHTSDKGTVTKKATCTAAGTKTYKCINCNKVLKTETIKATGHKEVILKAVTATAKKSGLTEGKKCSVCGKVTVAQKMTLAQVTSLKASTVAKTSIKLTWTKIAGAKYYKVEQSTDGKTWKTIKTVDTNSYTVSKLTAGKKYQFRVTALDSTKKIAGKASTVLKTGTLTSAPTVTLKSSKSKTAVASWKKVTGASKYIVYKSTDGKKWTKVTTTTKLTYTLTKLTGGKKIYVKVTAVNAYSKESAASTVRNVTVKK